MGQYREWCPEELAELPRITDSTAHVGQGAARTSKHAFEEASVTEADEHNGGVHLELEMNEPFLRLIGCMQAGIADSTDGARKRLHDAKDQVKVKKDRRKPTRLFARTLQIGQEKIKRTDKVDIVVKFLYRKPGRIVCELHENEEFKRIDILWTNMKTVHACFNDNRFDTLTIEVKSSLKHYRAARRLAGRHRQWQQCEDFAPTTIYLEFQKGTLERSYGKMLYTDPLLTLRSLSPHGKEEEAHTINTQQVLTQVEGAMPSTIMTSSNAGTNFTAYKYRGIQSYDSQNTIPRRGFH